MKRQSGFVLPLAVMILAVFALIAFGVAFTTNRNQNQLLIAATLDNSYHGAVQSGINFAEMDLKRADAPGSAHLWASNYTSTYNITLNGVKVHVKIEDILK